MGHAHWEYAAFRPSLQTQKNAGASRDFPQ